MRRSLLLVTAVAAAVLLAGCGGTEALVRPGEQVPSAAPKAGAPPITADEAAAMLPAFTATNNRANSALDAKLLATYEGEAMFAVDEAAFKMYRAAGRPPPQPFEYSDPRPIIPLTADGEPWFVLEATMAQSLKRAPMIFVKDGGAWKCVHGVPLGATLPDTATDAAGHAVAVPADDTTLIVSPKDLAEKHTQYLSVGETATDAKLFEPSEHMTEMLGLAGKIRSDVRFRVGSATRTAAEVRRSTVVGPWPIRALRAADGGALVAYSTATTFTAKVPGGTAALTPRLRGLGTPAKGSVSITVTALWWVQVPAKGKGSAVTILGAGHQDTKVS